MSNRDRAWHLERASLLRALTPEQRRRLEPDIRTLAVRRGERVYAPGEPSDELFVVKTGVVKLCATTADGREIVLAFANPGDTFGELAVVDEAPRDHRAEAHEDAVVCGVGRDLVVALIREAPEVGFELNRILGCRVRGLRCRVEELLCRSAEVRVARALVDLADAHGIADAEGVLVPLRLSQRDLANLAGLSRETVNAVLQDLRARSLVEADRRSIRIRQPSDLRALR